MRINDYIYYTIKQQQKEKYMYKTVQCGECLIGKGVGSVYRFAIRVAKFACISLWTHGRFQLNNLTSTRNSAQRNFHGPIAMRFCARLVVVALLWFCGNSDMVI